MKMIYGKFSLMVILFLAFYFVFCPQQINAQISQETSRLLRSARIQVLNQRMTPNDFTLQRLSGGSVSLSSLRGSVVILNFWATWCPPCRTEMPSMEILYQRYKNQGLEMLAVDLREDADTVRRFIQRNGYTFPVLLDLDGRVGGIYGIQSIPTTFIIDRDGMIIGRVVGSIYWNTAEMFAAIESLLNNR